MIDWLARRGAGRAARRSARVLLIAVVLTIQV